VVALMERSRRTTSLMANSLVSSSWLVHCASFFGSSPELVKIWCVVLLSFQLNSNWHLEARCKLE
jgi:hypothetical protein